MGVKITMLSPKTKIYNIIFQGKCQALFLEEELSRVVWAEFPCRQRVCLPTNTRMIPFGEPERFPCFSTFSFSFF
jgi:hypothetical protein